MWKHTIPLARQELIFKGSYWVPDETATDSPLPGFRYDGTITCFNLNDVFVWGCSDAEEFEEDTCERFEKILEEVHGIYHAAVILYGCRARGWRPQGPYYTYIPKELWHLYDACGPGVGKTCEPGAYKPEEQVYLKDYLEKK